ERQGLDHRRTVRGDQGAARRLLPHRGQGPERRHPGRGADSVGPVGLGRSPADLGVPTALSDAVDAVYRAESRRVLATLIRLLGDFDLAEEALQEAFAAAVERWPAEGMPSNPRAWLVSTGRFKAIDQLRRRARFDASLVSVAERLGAVLHVVYLVFNEGYSASAGATATRPDLSAEAIRLGRLLVELLPDPEVLGLLALMLLHDARRAARTSGDGEIVLLDEQDRSRWNRGQIAEGVALVERALAARRVGPFVLQAAIAAVHAETATPAATDWAEIVGLYDVLLRVEPSPVAELNRAAAVAMRDGPEAGLALIDAILARGELGDY